MTCHRFICRLDDSLRATVALQPHQTEVDCWVLTLQLFYQLHPAGETSFTLRGYSEQEAIALARDIGASPFIRNEIDQFLWSDSD